MKAPGTSTHLRGTRRCQLQGHLFAARALAVGAVLLASGAASAQASSPPLFDRENIELGYSSGHATGAGDLNQDGLDDLVVCGFGSARFYPGNGDGTFDRLGGSKVQGECSELAIASLDGDLYPDVVTEQPYGSPGLRVLEYDQATGLTQRHEIPIENGPIAFAVGDIDGDSATDLAVAHGTNAPDEPDYMTVYFNDGLGSFSEGSSSVAFGNFSSLSVGELTGDSAHDIVLATAPGVVQVIAGSPSRDLERLGRTRLERGGGLRVATGDISGETRDEVVAATAKEVLVLRSAPGGALRIAQSRPGGTFGGSDGVYTEDLNRDGRVDVIAAYTFGAYIYLTRSTGHLARQPNIQSSGHLPPDGGYTALSGLSFADFDEDKRMDFAGAENHLQLYEQIKGGVSCMGEPVNAMGSDLADHFDLRVPWAVVVHAGERNDTFEASPFDDLACGGPGAEYFIAGAGDDRIYGGRGDDGTNRRSGALNGGKGDDRLVGEAGDDQIGISRYASEDGDDVLVGGPGEDTLRAGAGDDVLRGGPGRDICDGDLGRDTFEGCEKITDR